MQVRRYLESMSEPQDTMYVEIEGLHRFTRRGQDWLKFRKDLIDLIERTISVELSKEFSEATEDWLSDENDQNR